MFFLKAEWRKLAIFNFRIDPEALQAYIPAGTELDLWEGNCYVSLVGFMFVNTSVLGINFPFHVNFEEVNLRFYVKHFDGRVWQRGVVFVKEIVPKSAITLIANTLYKEHYETRIMNHQWLIKDDKWHIRYEWKHQKLHFMKVIAGLDPIEIAAGSEAEFITEHYWGFTRINASQTSAYEVAHPRWQIYPILDYEIDIDFELVYGQAFLFLNKAQPVSVFLAEGSLIRVLKGHKVHGN